jgi:hypothetical protein
MNPIGIYKTRRVFWFDYDSCQLEQLPTKDWLCLATSDIDPNDEKYERFVRHTIQNGILEFKGHGAFGEKLHDIFDEIMVDIEISENTDTIDIMTTWHNDQSLADVLWQCFFATTLPDTANLDAISIVCTDIQGINRSEELKSIIAQFQKGWIPEK